MVFLSRRERARRSGRTYFCCSSTGVFGTAASSSIRPSGISPPPTTASPAAWARRLDISRRPRPAPSASGRSGWATGTLAAYARPGDTFVFYEINPEVVRMAQQYFTYLTDCRGAVDLVMGDARLSLEAELAAKQPQRFDLLVVDAFSGDAIPTHLLTREALELYNDHLAPNGVIAIHVSNNYLRLAPVVRRLAEDCGMLATRIDHNTTEEERMRLLSSSTWMLLTRNEAFARANPSQPPNSPDDDPNFPLWTDQYSNLFQILKSR